MTMLQYEIWPDLLGCLVNLVTVLRLLYQVLRDRAEAYMKAASNKALCS